MPRMVLRQQRSLITFTLAWPKLVQSDAGPHLPAAQVAARPHLSTALVLFANFTAKVMFSSSIMYGNYYTIAQRSLITFTLAWPKLVQSDAGPHLPAAQVAARPHLSTALVLFANFTAKVMFSSSIMYGNYYTIAQPRPADWVPPAGQVNPRLSIRGPASGCCLQRAVSEQSSSAGGCPTLPHSLISLAPHCRSLAQLLLLWLLRYRRAPLHFTVSAAGLTRSAAGLELSSS
ncbi:hypothetical protein V8C86DRAFT_2433394 [Haematococcus lacustris]